MYLRTTGITFELGLLHGQRLAARDLDNWEQRRVPRPPGEPDGGF